MPEDREELLKHLAASLKDAKEDGGAILLVGAGISVSAGIPPAQKLMKIAIENFPNYFTKDEQKLAQENLNLLQYNDIMTKLSNVKRKELFKWFIEGNEEKGIQKAKLNFAHIAIAELLKQRYFSRVLTVNFDPLLIHACYMVGMYPFPAIYDLGAMGQMNAELLHDPSIVYLNGQHVGFVQRNTTDQLRAHKETLSQIVRSTGCSKTWVVAGYSGENDPLMDALKELRPYNNWLYWLEYNEQVLQKESHQFLENDEECKVIYECDADETFMVVAEILNYSLDFIEQPEIELRNYNNFIDFNTAGKKAKIFKYKLNNYIQLLESSTVKKHLNNYEKVQIHFEESEQKFELKFKNIAGNKLTLEDKRELIEPLDKILKLNIEVINALFKKAFTLFLIQDYQEDLNLSEITLNESIKIFEELKALNDPRAFVWLSIIYFTKDKINLSLSNLRQIIEIFDKKYVKDLIDETYFEGFLENTLIRLWYIETFEENPHIKANIIKEAY